MSIPRIDLRRIPPAAGLVLVAVLSLLAFSSCPGKAPAGKSVVLVTVESLRADRLVGPPRDPDPLPNLRALAGPGHVAAALASSSEALPSLVSIMTGLSPARHGVLVEGLDRIGPDAPTLAARFREAGYRTAGFPGLGVLGLPSGLSRGFEGYGWPPSDLVMRGSLASTNGENWLADGSRRPGQAAVADALTWVRRHRGEPMFLWIHLADSAAPYATDRDLLTLFGEDRYDAALRYEDRCIKALVDGFASLGLKDRTLFVVAGDHGESLGDHGESYHGLTLYPSAIATAVAVIAPGGEGTAPVAASAPPAAGTSSAPGRLLDLYPWILGIAGIDSRASAEADRSPFDAASVEGATVPSLPAVSAQRPLLAITLGPRSSFGWRGAAALYDGAGAWFGPEEEELYALAGGASLGESLFEREPDRARAMREKALEGLKPVAGRLQGRPDVPKPEVRARLLPLLRQAAAAMEAQKTEDEKAALRAAWTLDPGNFEVARWLARASGLMAQKDNPPLLAQIESRGGDLPEAWLTIAMIRERTPRSGDALEARARACRGGAAGCAVTLGLAQVRASQLDQAVKTFAPLAEAGRDPDLWRVLGEISLGVQDTYRASQAFEKAVALRPKDPDLLIRQGDCLAATRDVKGAEARYEAARALQPDLPLVELRLGKLYRQKGDRAAAVEHFRAGLGVDPNTSAGAIALGRLLTDEGMAEEAVPLFLDAASKDTSSVDPLYYAAEALATEGKVDEAEAQLRRALDRDGHSPAVLYQLARLVVFKGNREEGGKLLERLAEVAPPDVAVAALRDDLFTNDAPGQPLAKGLQALYEAVKKATPPGSIITVPSSEEH